MHTQMQAHSVCAHRLIRGVGNSGKGCLLQSWGCEHVASYSFKVLCHDIHRVGQNRIYTPYMTVYLVIFLPKLPYIHRIPSVHDHFVTTLSKK